MILIAILLMLAGSGVGAQTKPATAKPQPQATPVDPCVAAAPPYTVTSGAPFTVAWLMAPTVPFSPTNPTPVPNRHNGFYLQIDSTMRQDIGKPSAGAPCPAGTPRAGFLPYSFRTSQGVSRGAHTVVITPWNFTLAADGTETTQRQDGEASSIPFDAGDPTVLTGPPGPPQNGSVKQ